jgi:membrane-bound lytic murein transglycosylase D
VAHTYSVSVSALASANQLDSTSRLDGVEALVVPVAPAAAPSAHTVYYTTRRGDTLVSVADRFGISLTQLRRWNKLPASGIKIEAGRRLHVAEPAVVRTSTSSRHGKSKSAHGHNVAGAAAPEHASSSGSGSKTTAKAHSSKKTHTSTASKHSTHSKSSTQGQN